MNQSVQEKRAGDPCLSPSAESATPFCFAGVLDKLDNGVLIASPANNSIPYCNISAGEILASIGLETDYDSLSSFLQAKNISLTQVEKDRQKISIIHNNRILELTLDRLPDDSICLQLMDITEQKRMESIAQTVNTMDNLGFIFSGIRHEIGNPLNSIKMTNSVLQKNLKRFSLEDISRYIDRTASEITRMEYLLKSLKNFSMYEKTDCQPHDLNAFLITLLGLIEPDLLRKNILLDHDFPEDSPQVNIDPRALHQAMLNLVTNAADAVSEKPDAKISIRAELDGHLVWVVVKDNGCGMSEEQIKMLYQPFYTNKAHGNGLGLVITRKLLTMMQASLTINSRLGKGSTARIGLPMTGSAISELHSTTPHTGRTDI